jgi:broad specificity phosphatase PhoE
MANSIEHLTLHFVRHGETAGNAERRFQWPDTPLSEQGLAQAAAVAETLHQTTHAAQLLASDYRRTMQTAEAIGISTGLPIVAEAALRERNFGIARGRLYADIGEETLKRWGEPHFRIEQGESWADVYDRVGAFLAGLRASPPGRELILVTHGGAMSVALSILGGTPIDNFKVMTLDNCAVRTVAVPIETDRSSAAAGS